MFLIKSISMLALSLASFSATAQLGEPFKVPDTWAKDFVIKLSYHSSMSGGKTEITFTYDACTYLSQASHSKKNRQRTVKLTEASRTAILKKLADLRIDQVKSEGGTRVVNDGWSQLMCFGFHCIDGGTSAEMSEADKNVFLEAWRYLEEFASKKKR